MKWPKDGRRIKGVVLDEGDYYLINVPANMTRSRDSIIGEVIDAVAIKNVPIVISFSRVRRFDTSGVAFLSSIATNYRNRRIYSVGMVKIVQDLLENTRLYDRWKERCGSYDSLDDLLNSGNLGSQ